jgi:omega-6 fatty acid desaturase (delta-12 desaturase)
MVTRIGVPQRTKPSTSSSPRRKESGRYALKGAAAVLPAECRDKPTWRGLTAICGDLTLYVVMISLLALSDSLLVLIPAWLIAASAISGLFVLGHDAAHGALFRNPRLNSVLGQLVMLPGLHAFSVWAYGHNRIHHAFATCEGIDFVWHPVTARQYARLTPLGKLLHRIEWSALGSGLYYVRAIWWEKIVCGVPPARLRAAFRRDRAIVAAYLVVVAAGLFCVGARAGGWPGAVWMWMKVFGVPWALWNCAIGWAVYIHHIAPDVRWRPRRHWNAFGGQIEGATIYHVPRWVNIFWHNIFLHVPHHIDPTIPFYHLPRAAAALRLRYSDALRERRYRLRDYVRTTRQCKLYDFERGIWLTYDTQRSPSAPSAASV